MAPRKLRRAISLAILYVSVTLDLVGTKPTTVAMGSQRLNVYDKSRDPGSIFYGSPLTDVCSRFSLIN